LTKQQNIFRGGNSVVVMFFSQRTNLHATWDAKMIQKWTNNLDDAVTEVKQSKRNKEKNKHNKNKLK